MNRSLLLILIGLSLFLVPSATQAEGEDSTVFREDIPADTTIVTTASGLKYSVLREGTGAEKPASGEKVRVHYTGWTTDGKVFDSSRKRGKPAEFLVGQLVPGWNEALKLMTVGSRFKLTIPPALAYGASGRPPTIPPNATLIFDMELLDIVTMPKFHEGAPDTKIKTESGLVYWMLEAGKGDPIAAGLGVEIEFALFNTKGALVACSQQRGEMFRGTAASMPFPFLHELLPLMRLGGSLWCEVPPQLGLGARGAGPLIPPTATSVWKITVKSTFVIDVPEFSMPAKENLKTTASGLQYEVIREGEGASPIMYQFVTCHYAGWLTDGTLFDASYLRGKEASFMLGRVIPGWNEGLQMMKPGAIYKFVIPGKLAYGPQGRPPKIGPNATLVFQVHLIKLGQ